MLAGTLAPRPRGPRPPPRSRCRPRSPVPPQIENRARGEAAERPHLPAARPAPRAAARPGRARGRGAAWRSWSRRARARHSCAPAVSARLRSGDLRKNIQERAGYRARFSAARRGGFSAEVTCPELGGARRLSAPLRRDCPPAAALGAPRPRGSHCPGSFWCEPSAEHRFIRRTRVSNLSSAHLRTISC